MKAMKDKNCPMGWDGRSDFLSINCSSHSDSGRVATDYIMENLQKTLALKFSSPSVKKSTLTLSHILFLGSAIWSKGGCFSLVQFKCFQFVLLSNTLQRLWFLVCVIFRYIWFSLPHPCPILSSPCLYPGAFPSASSTSPPTLRSRVFCHPPRPSPLQLLVSSSHGPISDFLTSTNT